MFNKKEIELLKKENKALKEENKKLRKSYGLSKTKELKAENQVLYEENEMLKKTIDNKCENIRGLDEELTNIRLENLEIKKQLDSYRQNLIVVKESKEKLQRDYDKLLDEFNPEIEKLKQEIEKLKQEELVKDKEMQIYIQAINNATLTLQKSEKQIKPKTNKEIK